MSMNTQVKNKFSKVDLDETLTLVLVDAYNYNESNVEVVKYLSNIKKLVGVYVTVNKPYKTVYQLFKKEKINTDAILFIDCISRVDPKRSNKEDNCLYVGSPQNLTGISIAISEAVQALPTKDKFLFLDSLSTLSIYNSTGSMLKFSHFITNNMRKWGITGIIICLEKESDASLITQLEGFCDTTVNLNKDTGTKKKSKTKKKSEKKKAVKSKKTSKAKKSSTKKLKSKNKQKRSR